jgi:hypothetical protein
MPQMGESIAEGTITKWYKKVGDKIAKDETLLEISTDKVDSEIPSPSAGVVAELLFPEQSMSIPSLLESRQTQACRWRNAKLLSDPLWRQKDLKSFRRPRSSNGPILLRRTMPPPRMRSILLLC